MTVYDATVYRCPVCFENDRLEHSRQWKCPVHIADGSNVCVSCTPLEWLERESAKKLISIYMNRGAVQVTVIGSTLPAIYALQNGKNIACLVSYNAMILWIMVSQPLPFYIFALVWWIVHICMRSEERMENDKDGGRSASSCVFFSLNFFARCFYEFDISHAFTGYVICTEIKLQTNRET